ncbi:hypothetical protein SynMINOS11_02361 [Synechococcus sp. Minos11]|uniref:hypothetical protein n=1 Tax=Synechococcus sp. Minos11 TaxID=221341 RepID=UPI000E05D620|nr:hypothetical protein [Synechococcus sp. Minos11]QNJ09807.1 hypothetical protein SynMINOS11_02361 [Synechococcus sp. Minos11]RCL63922.1 MAG: hypothetical protein DBW81_00885 [Synechococcus sp. MED-G67]HCV57321.1 hypothetical protein [Synechococcales bacterium UBA12195]|tara:strand:- start:143 stop:736 length:594 start_codon:yes stop_codon:yes gene_type:complete
MAELKVKLSDKALSLIAQLQKEIFNRRRKKVTPSGVVETLVESAAKSQSDKRFATSWKNLVVDIEKAAKLANQHGSKPSNLSDEEWAMVLSHRTRPVKTGNVKAKTTTTRRAVAKKAAPKKAVAKKTTAKKATTTTKVTRKAAAKPAARKTARAASPAKAKRSTGSVAKRMAKAASKLGSGAATSSNGVGSATATLS